MLVTVMPAAAHASRSTTSVPVAATAIRRSRSAARMASRRSGTLLVISTSAPAIRSATWSGVVRSYTTISCGKPGARSRAWGDSVPRSRNTMRAGRSSERLVMARAPRSVQRQRRNVGEQSDDGQGGEVNGQNSGPAAAARGIATVRDMLSTQVRASLEWGAAKSWFADPLADAAHDVTEPRQTEVSLRDKVRFLRRPDSYPERPRAIEVKESHMSWLFLTEEHAYKLKKPVRYSYLDYSTLAARAENCAAEVRLNRRFARGVYLGLVPLNVDPSGHLRLGGAGATCDWLVKMARLPAERTLEAQIARDELDEAGLRQAVHVLTRVYREATPVDMTATVYRKRFRDDIGENLAELIDPAFGLSSELPGIVASAEWRFVEIDAELLDARVEGGRIVEGHGDLRPEHVYLGDPPIIMDCLEFNRMLRLLDPVDELAYLAIECHRLGAPHLGEIVLDTYRADTGDRPPTRLIDFYASLRAMLRAKLAIWHLRDEHRTDSAKWRTRTMRYVDIAAEHAPEPR